MRKKIFGLDAILLLAGLCFLSSLFAQEKTGIAETAIGSTFKALAKTYLATAEINKLKRSNIDKLNNMDEEQFQIWYTKVYGVIKNLPSSLKGEYRITEHMAKEEIIKNIRSLDKKKMYEIIDSLPDEFVVNYFKNYFKNQKQEIQENNIFGRIKDLWNKIIEKAQGK